MCRATARARLDVLWFPATYTYFPVWGVERLVVTMHDALPMLHPELVFPTRRGRMAWALKERLAAWQADRVTTPSEASKGDLVRVYGLDASRVEVIPEAADPVFRTTADDDRSRDVLQRVGVPPGTPFLLYVGGLAPHKNLIRLIEAFAAAAPEPYLLVLVGDPGDVFHSHVPELHREVERHEISKRTVFAGFVADSDLTYLYGRTHSLVQPSLLEGFGLPPVEAMACSSPVLYSQRGSLPEVVGDAGLAFDPLDVGSIAAAIARITADPELRADLAWRALARSSLFSWDETGRRLLASLESVRAQPQRRTG
jgi:glycosyltransferase involved in cell wall biosynthesis